ncbi:hypothetical protein R6Q59_010179 [Mikania micrantha]
MLEGLYIDDRYDSLSTGRYKEISGEVKPCIFDHYLTRTRTYMIQDNRRFDHSMRLKEMLLICYKILFTETEKLLEKWKHPDPYRPPTAPGGIIYGASKFSYSVLVKAGAILQASSVCHVHDPPHSCHAQHCKIHIRDRSNGNCMHKA